MLWFWGACWAQGSGHTHGATAATSLRNVRSPPLLPPNYLGPSHHSQGPCDPLGPRGFCCSAWISAHTVAMCTWRPPGPPPAVFSESWGGTKDAAAPADARGVGWTGLVPRHSRSHPSLRPGSVWPGTPRSHSEQPKARSSAWSPEYAAQKLIKLKDFQLVMIYTFGTVAETRRTFVEVSQKAKAKYS